MQCSAFIEIALSLYEEWIHCNLNYGVRLCRPRQRCLGLASASRNAWKTSFKLLEANRNRTVCAFRPQSITLDLSKHQLYSKYFFCTHKMYWLNEQDNWLETKHSQYSHNSNRFIKAPKRNISNQCATQAGEPRPHDSHLKDISRFYNNK